MEPTLIGAELFLSAEGIINPIGNQLIHKDTTVKEPVIKIIAISIPFNKKN